MAFPGRLLLVLSILLCVPAGARGEVLIRWDQRQIPSRESLGVPGVVVPAGQGETLRAAFAGGYRVYVEADSSALAKFTPPGGIAGVVVKGKTSAADVSALRRRLGSPAVRIMTLEASGKWPHIRSNWVTKNREGVLQVTGRSAQPWIENNAALVRILRATRPGAIPTLTYAWQPMTVSDADEGPRLEDYLVAIAESGSLGADLVLPLHEQFQRRLLLGQPQARAEWAEIRRYLEFYAWDLTRRYEPAANIGVVSANPTFWFEVMNLLMRHNLPFELIPPAELARRKLDGLQLLIVLEQPDRAGREALAALERAGGLVRIVEGSVDPNGFALDMRQLLGRERRLIDVWNGITVLTWLYAEPGGTGALLTVLNYAHQPLPIQLRVAGTYAQAQYESPDDPAAYLPVRHRNGFTEFVLPSVRIGGRVFLTH
jgi:hypothetical protein